jgi:hypothetical protein
MRYYRTKKVEYNGIKFDSKMERDRYVELRRLEKAGEIGMLAVHPKYCLLPSFRHGGKTYREITYSPDFRYFRNGKQVFEDVKGYATDTYKLKMKMFVSQLREHDEFKEISKCQKTTLKNLDTENLTET